MLTCTYSQVFELSCHYATALYYELISCFLDKHPPHQQGCVSSHSHNPSGMQSTSFLSWTMRKWSRWKWNMSRRVSFKIIQAHNGHATPHPFSLDSPCPFVSRWNSVHPIPYRIVCILFYAIVRSTQTCIHSYPPAFYFACPATYYHPPGCYRCSSDAGMLKVFLMIFRHEPFHCWRWVALLTPPQLFLGVESAVSFVVQSEGICRWI